MTERDDEFAQVDARDKTIGVMLQSQHKQERELIILKETANKMLAALKAADGRIALDVETIFKIRAAIAEAEAAGIKAEE